MTTPIATVIGDVVGSRDAADRSALHARLVDALDLVNDRFEPIVPFRITVGDEYQGGFATVGEALVVSLRLRLLVHPAFDLRHGIGWGTVTVLDADPRVEDGPGWWSARAAIEAVGSKAGHGTPRGVRTSYRRDEGTDGPDEAAVNAALIARDTLLAAAPSRSWGVLRGLLNDMSQQEIARLEGVSASAVSQRVRRDGLAALVAVDALLGAVR